MNLTKDQTLYAAAMRSQLTPLEQVEMAKRLDAWMRAASSHETDAVNFRAYWLRAERRIASLKGVITRLKKTVHSKRVSLGEVRPKCEGCGKPASCSDAEGVDLCHKCARALKGGK